MEAVNSIEALGEGIAMYAVMYDTCPITPNPHCRSDCSQSDA